MELLELTKSFHVNCFVRKLLEFTRNTNVGFPVSRQFHVLHISIVVPFVKEKALFTTILNETALEIAVISTIVYTRVGCFHGNKCFQFQ